MTGTVSREFCPNNVYRYQNVCHMFKTQPNFKPPSNLGQGPITARPECVKSNKQLISNKSLPVVCKVIKKWCVLASFKGLSLFHVPCAMRTHQLRPCSTCAHTCASVTTPQQAKSKKPLPVPAFKPSVSMTIRRRDILTICPPDASI